MNKSKIYGGIYTKGPSKKTDAFIMDPVMTLLENKLAPYYILETIAHNLMVAKQGIIPKNSAVLILKNLLKLSNKADGGKLINPTIGDVHENVESILTKSIGENAAWFHIARSRNDQTVVDQKLFTKKCLLEIFEMLNKIENTLANKTALYVNAVMPGYTHMRLAMPSSFGFWWQSYLDQILDIHTILKSVYEVYDKCPLGAGASYGVNWKIDPAFTAQKLGFAGPFLNALSAIDNRGIEDANIIGQLSIILTVLSRMMEDLIIWSMPELNYVAISEEFTTGSSIMPQKMNPDIAEKIKSKSSKLIANLNHVLIAMKGTPSGYNRDSAESKVAIISSLEETLSTLSIANDLFEKIIPNVEIMKQNSIPSLPTKLADMLVKQYHIPFRTAHKIVGKTIHLVQGEINKITGNAIESSIELIMDKKINIDEQLIKEVFDVNSALNQYEYEGSAGPEHVLEVNEKLIKKTAMLKKWTNNKKDIFVNAQENLIKEVENYIKS